MSVAPFFFDPSDVSEEVSGTKLIENPCEVCGLDKTCKTPRMKMFGKGKKNILIIGEAPGAEEDGIGRGFVGRSGKMLKDILSSNGVSMDVDCRRTNVMLCRPPGNVFLPEKAAYCYNRVEGYIKKAKPSLVIAFGRHAAWRLVENDIVPGISPRRKELFGLCVNDVYPVRKYRAWVALLYHLAAVMRNPDLSVMIRIGIEKALTYADKPFPRSLIQHGENKYIEGEKRAEIIRELINAGKPCAFDYETNQLNPFIGDPRVVYVSFSVDKNIGYVMPVDAEFYPVIQEFLRSPVLKIAQNSSFERLWSKVVVGAGLRNLTWDTMLAAHLLDERKGKKNLGYLMFRSAGETHKGLVDVEHIEKNPLASIIKYSSLDSRGALRIASEQSAALKLQKRYDCHKMQLGWAWAMCRMMERGIKIDMEQFKSFSAETATRRKAALKTIESNPAYQKYTVRHGKINLNSDGKLAQFFFGNLGMEPYSYTAKDTPQVNHTFFTKAAQDFPEHKDLLESIHTVKQLDKLKGTFLASVHKYIDSKHRLHPTLDLSTAETGRSACRNPNLQNPPARNEFLRQFRRIFIPENDILLEADYKGAEVTVAGIRSLDKKLISELQAGADIHAEWIERIYHVTGADAKKKRSQVKNGFTFPLLYGAGEYTIAEGLEIPVRAAKKHINDFFRKYRTIHAYQKALVEKYNRCGFVDLPMGFRRNGPLSYNQIVNTDIQGPTGFCLFDGCERFERLAMRYKLRTRAVLQVHDSLLLDLVLSEAKTAMELATLALTQKKDWDWVRHDIPLVVDWKYGKNWCDMTEFKAEVGFVSL